MYDHKGHATREIDIRDDANLSAADDTAGAIDDGLLADLFETDYLICQLQLDGVSFTDKHDAIALRNELVAHCGIAGEDGLNDSGLGQCGGVGFGNASAFNQLLDAVLVRVGDKHHAGLLLEDSARSLDLELGSVVALVYTAVESLVVLNGHFLNGVADLAEGAEARRTVDLAAVIVVQGERVKGVDLDGCYTIPVICVAEEPFGNGLSGEMLYELRGSFFCKIYHLFSSMSDGVPALVKRILSSGCARGFE